VITNYPFVNFASYILLTKSKYPDKYIYEPWTAPLNIQKQSDCIIGQDYPFPIVDHDKASKENMAKMKIAYAATSTQSETNENKAEISLCNKNKRGLESIFEKKKK
jgi:cryptochrome